MRKFLLCLLFGFSIQINAQPLTFWDEVEVKVDGNYLKNAFAGGLNQPQLSVIDLNHDSLLDIFVFDRAGNTILPFVNKGNAGTPDYRYAPQYKTFFPELNAWAILADYDCDGKVDIFSSWPDSSGIMVYRNISTSGSIEFQLEDSILKTTDGTTIFVNATDVPAFADVDADGDLDILTFDSQGSQVRFFENSGGCGSLDFIVNTNCWGQFEEAGQDNGIFLNTACKRNNGSSNRHSGSSLLAFDIDGDKALELLLGDLNHPNIVYLHNGGDSAFALMDQANTSFPPETSPVDIRQFPASFYLDVNQDTKKDLVFAPNAPNISLNSNQVWYYQNTGSSANQSFTLIQKDFLVGEMIDVGTVSNPAFFDYNGDGLLDLVVGNYLFRESVNQESSGLFLFENTGSPTLPEYELVNSNYLNLESLFNPAIFGLSPTFGDLDNDGDKDMIIGDENGNLHYFQNQANQSNMLADFILFAPFFASIDVGGSATPQLIDLNQDGLLDLLIGEKSGNLNYYENQGTLEQPFFSTGNNKFGFVDVLPECCTGYSVPFAFENNHGGINLVVGSEAGELFYYSDINQHLNDTFPLSSYQLGEINEGGRISVTGADLNQDNKLDFIFGNRRGGLSLYKSDLFIGIDENKDSFSASVKIFPNPSLSGTEIQVAISNTHQASLSLELFSLEGRLLKRMEHKHSSHTSTLSLGKLASGIYFLKVNSNDKMIGSIKIVVL